MKKYIHIIAIIVITIGLGAVSQFNIDLFISSIVYTVSIICIVILAKRTNTYEEKLLNKLSNIIHKILNISTLLLIIITVGVNLISYNNITDTYNKLSNKDLLKFNTVAIKNVAIDFISTIDTIEYLTGNEETRYEISNTYEDIETKTVFGEVKDTVEGVKNIDVIEVIKSTYWLSSNFKRTRNLCVLTILAYISIIYRIKVSKYKNSYI